MPYDIGPIKFKRGDLVLSVLATIKKEKREELRKTSDFLVCLFDVIVRPVTDLRSRYGLEDDESCLDMWSLRFLCSKPLLVCNTRLLFRRGTTFAYSALCVTEINEFAHRE